MKKMNGPIIMFIIIAFVVYKFILSNDNNVATQQVPQTDSRAPRQDVNSYGLRGADDTWPSLETNVTEVASDIMAKNYYLVIDGSGSMADEGCSNGKAKLDVAKQALKSFINKLPGNANVGVFAFDRGGIGERLPLAQHDPTDVVRAINRIDSGGGTPLSSGIEAGTDVLTRQAKKQLGYGEYHLVVVTDGEASSKYEPDTAVHRLLVNSPIVLHTIGFCISDNHSLNQPGYTIYRAANNPQDLLAGLESVLAEAPDFQVADFGQTR